MSNNKPPRRFLRQCAAQFLYSWDSTKPALEQLDIALEDFWETVEMPEEGKGFTQELITGTIDNLNKINTLLRERIKNYDLSRVHKVDLSILRVALYELLFRIDIPPVVTINEAVEIAKDLSNDDAGKFVNGILDKVASTLDRPLREPGV